MATFSKEILSGSVAGIPIALTSASTMIHQTTATAGVEDEVWLWGSNFSSVSASVNVTVTIGAVDATATTASVITLYNTAGLTPILPGIPLTPSGSSNTRLEVQATAGSPAGSNLVNVVGYVNRITP